MKSLKKIKAFSGLGRKSPGSSSNNHNGDSSGSESPRVRADTSSDAQGDGPEGIAARNVRFFCESSAGPNSGDEILFLPPIVDAAESSPEAAAECARIIRQYLRKTYKNSPSFQYNAIMLMRILADNPGATFTRNFDQKFTETCKGILMSPDRRVNQMMMDTLDAFEHQKSYDQNLAMIISMWQQEKSKALQKSGGAMPHNWQPPSAQGQARPTDPHSQNYFARQHQPRRTLPDPTELAGRLEEARTSAKVLHDIVANTPPHEVLSNDLIKEFADRCLSASRSIQGYMNATEPTPDHDTMESLIDTNEQLQASMNLHQRAMLNARKLAGLREPGEEPSPVTETDRNEPLARRHSPATVSDDDGAPSVPEKTNGKGKQRNYESPGAGPSRSDTPQAEEDPFKDPEPQRSDYLSAGASGSGKGKARYDSGEYDADDGETSRHYNEPYHPGFGATQSYMGRQESALGKEAMHGAIPGGASSSTDAQQANRISDADSYDGARREPTYRY